MILKELKELPDLLAATSRSSLKRARDPLNTQVRGVRPGDEKIPLQKEDGTGATTASCLHPAARIAYAASHCQAFAGFLAARMDESPPSFMQPWSLVWYSDKVTPGNQLKHDNKRKVQVIYYSMKELGMHALSTENVWFSLLVLQSSVAKKIGGMNVVFHQLAEFFFHQPDCGRGLPIRILGQNRVLFAKLGILILDEAAINQTHSNKGAAGLVFCACRHNALDKNELTNHAGEDLVSSLETDMTKFRFHTPASIEASMKYLAEQKEITLPKGRFEALETALGFNFKPQCLLSHPGCGPCVISCLMSDWFHIYLAHAIFNILTGFFLGDLHANGWKAENIDEFANDFQWPARLRGGACKDIPQKRKPRDTLKCSASEALNFLQYLVAASVLLALRSAGSRRRHSIQLQDVAGYLHCH